MKVKFLKPHKGYKQGDIVDSKDDFLTIQGLIRSGIVKVVKQKKYYNDKMMRNYQDK